MSTELPSFLVETSPGHYTLTMSSSAAETMMLCNAKYSWSRVTGIEAVAARAGMNYGKALHLLLAALYNGKPFDAAAILSRHFAANPQPTTTSKGKPEWRTEARALAAYQAYLQHYGAEDFEVLGVEEPFEVELGKFEAERHDLAIEVTVRIRGIRDLRVRWHDQLWVHDHKTSTEWSDLTIDEGKANFQFMEYTWVEKLLRMEKLRSLEAQGTLFTSLHNNCDLDLPVGGVIGNYIISRAPYSEGRKPTPRDLPRDQFQREPYPFSDAQLAEWHEDAMDVAKSIFTSWQTQNWKRNRTACAHWGRCEYYRLCWETDPAYREAAALSADYRPRTPSPFEDAENGKERE